MQADTGTTSYLCNSGTRRFLFTGDMLWTQHGQWEASVEGERFIDVVTPDQVRERLDAIIARVTAGSSH
jgi:glyoxylase-like metal-dependent hydrolase (beta-lactamase superfamily II)